jgi:hypothetical protein|tara:strand:- start:1568 stop:1696 length:129 start_codon:yes stop_codon:yes gene_type:complete
MKTKRKIKDEKLLDMYLAKLMQEPKKEKIKPKTPFWGIFEKK